MVTSARYRSHKRPKVPVDERADRGMGYPLHQSIRRALQR